MSRAGDRLARRQLPRTRDKVRRAIWRLTWLLLFRPSPVSFHGWRCSVLRLFGAKIGRGARPYPTARIWAPWNLVMRDFSCVADEVDCYNVAAIELGERAIVSQKSFLCTASHDYQSTSFELLVGPIIIGASAWVAADAFLGPGVRIGEGAVLGARSVAVNDIDDWIVAVGNPARPVGRRTPR